MSKEAENKKSSLATVGLILGIIGISTSFIPIINNASFVLGILASIFGLIALIKKAKKGKAIAALILGVLAIIITMSLQNSWSKSLNDLSNDLDNISGENTEEVLKNVDIEIGEFKVITDEYGFEETKLEVTITNKLEETTSYDFKIEAVDENGNRITDETIYASDLGANQSQKFTIFEYIDSDIIDDMKNASFNIVEASMY